MRRPRLVKRVFREISSLYRDTQFRGLLSLVIILIFVGGIFYSRTQHWSMLNSLYFCVITLTTVGYGDYTPHTSGGKIFTMFYALIGIGILLGFINVVARRTTKRYLKQSERQFERMEDFVEGLAKSKHKETGSPETDKP